MLNDIARPTRLLIAGFGVSIGLMLAGPVTGASSGRGFTLIFAGLGVEVLMLLAFPLVLGVAERRFRSEVVAAGAEIASGTVTPVPAPGRVVRRRVVRLPWWMPGRGGGGGAAMLLVATVLGDGPARRVAAVVPADLGIHLRRAPVALLVHPRRRDVAVLDDRVTPQLLEAIAGDPRWRSERLPSDRTVVGGYLALLGSLVVGTALGGALALAVLRLAT